MPGGSILPTGRWIAGESSAIAIVQRFGLTYQRDPLHRLQSGDEWGHRPAWQQLLDLPCSRSSGFPPPEGVNVILQHDLLRRMGEPHRGQPETIGQRSRHEPLGRFGRAGQKTMQMLARLGKYPARRRPGCTKSRKDFMGGIGDLDRSQLNGAVQP
jgi:hypothetical protein